MGVMRHTFRGRSYWVAGVAFWSDGRTVASGSCDETVRLLDSTTDELAEETAERWAWELAKEVADHGIASDHDI
jgi:WD40 repeat protein